MQAADSRFGTAHTRCLFAVQAKARGTSLLFMPKGMARRDANTTRGTGKGGTACIKWRVEWVFDTHSADVAPVKVVDAHLDERTTLRAALERYLVPQVVRYTSHAWSLPLWCRLCSAIA